VGSRSTPQPGEVWKHFKGGVYTIITRALHTETSTDMVVYARKQDNKTYARPLGMFMASVNRGGRNVWRFERVDE